MGSISATYINIICKAERKEFWSAPTDLKTKVSALLTIELDYQHSLNRCFLQDLKWVLVRA